MHQASGLDLTFSRKEPSIVDIDVGRCGEHAGTMQSGAEKGPDLYIWRKAKYHVFRLYCTSALGRPEEEYEEYWVKLKAKGLKWLKGFHLIAVSCWVGGGVSLILLFFLKPGVNDGNVLYGINLSIHHVDMAVVVVPGAFGCLVTGLLYSAFSNWGFFKHTWLIFKWIVTLAAILFGTFFLGPWETAMMDLSGKLGMASLSNTEYLYYEKMNLVFGTLQVVVLIVTIFISIFKPWKSRPAGK